MKKNSVGNYSYSLSSFIELLDVDKPEEFWEIYNEAVKKLYRR